MTPPTLSSELVDWARQAGYSLSLDSDTATFWTDPGGETRVYIRRDSKGWIMVTSADRGGEERFELSAVDTDVAERYLWKFFGTVVRANLHLPWLEVPTEASDRAPGYAIEEREDGFAYLSDPRGKIIAKGRGGFMGIAMLVWLSRLVSAPASDIKATYEDEKGRPVFSQ